MLNYPTSSPIDEEFPQDQAKGSQQVLIDGGPSPQALGLELSKKMPFWNRTLELPAVPRTREPTDDRSFAQEQLCKLLSGMFERIIFIFWVYKKEARN